MGQRQHKRKARKAVSQPRHSVVGSAQPVIRRPLLTAPVIAVSVAIAVLITVVYAQARHFEFVYLDDAEYVVENANVLRGVTWDGIKWAFTTGAAGNWHPLTWISHMLDIELYGLRAGGHHVTSVILHIANSLLLFGAVYRMTSGLGKSAVVAALFAVHPLHVESVAWIAERKDVLSTLFWILTVHAYISYVGNPNRKRQLLVTCAFALGLMSKPMLVTLPFTLLLLDYWPLMRITRENLAHLSSWIPLVREKIPLFILSAVSIAVTIRVQRSAGAVVAMGQLPFVTRFGNSIVSYAAYLRDLLWPANLAAFYPFHEPALSSVAVAALVMVAITVFVMREGPRHPYLLVGWAWFVGTLIPTIGLVQVGDQARADRYTYVPAIGLFMIVVWGISELTSSWRFARATRAILATIVLTACAAVSLRQVGYWRDNISLFTRAIAVTSGNYRAEALLGVALSVKGRYEEAIRHYNTSLKILPGNAETHSNLGSALVDLGRKEEALHEFSEAVRFKPSSPIFHYNLAVMLNEKGRTREAIDELRTSVRLDPGNPEYGKALDLLVEYAKRK